MWDTNGCASTLICKYSRWPWIMFKFPDSKHCRVLHLCNGNKLWWSTIYCWRVNRFVEKYTGFVKFRCVKRFLAEYSMCILCLCSPFDAASLALERNVNDEFDASKSTNLDIIFTCFSTPLEKLSDADGNSPICRKILISSDIPFQCL